MQGAWIIVFGAWRLSDRLELVQEETVGESAVSATITDFLLTNCSFLDSYLFHSYRRHSHDWYHDLSRAVKVHSSWYVTSVPYPRSVTSTDISVGRKEIVMFFYMFALVELLAIFLDSGIIPTASNVYPVGGPNHGGVNPR